MKLTVKLEDLDFENCIDRDSEFINFVESKMKDLSGLHVSKSFRMRTRDSAPSPNTITQAAQLITGLHLTGSLIAVGYILKQLVPIVIQYLKNRKAKEVTVEVDGRKLTLKSGAKLQEAKDALALLAAKNDESESV